MHRKVIRFNYFLWVFVLAVFLSSCSKEPVSIPAVGSPAVSETPLGPVVALTSTPFSPSATPVELAAQVNGEGIPLIDYQAELSRFDASSGTGLVTYGPEKVLEDMIDQILLAQGANQAGFFVTENILQDHINQFDIAEQDLQNWIIQYGYTEESFRRAMSWSIAAAWMRDQIVMAVPTTADQVHARQILLYNSNEADQVYSQLDTGTDFETLAAKYEPATSGDLGWFPRGYLTVPELDDVVFSLEPGQYSSIIQTSLGYHIVQVIERQADVPLSPGAYRVLQTQAIQKWLDEHRDQSEIIVFLP
jgi:peptidyl-prolyl cis-trans isomerase C